MEKIIIAIIGLVMMLPTLSQNIIKTQPVSYEGKIPSINERLDNITDNGISAGYYVIHGIGKLEQMPRLKDGLFYESIRFDGKNEYEMLFMKRERNEKYKCNIITYSNEDMSTVRMIINGFKDNKHMEKSIKKILKEYSIEYSEEKVKLYPIAERNKYAYAIVLFMP